MTIAVTSQRMVVRRRRLIAADVVELEFSTMGSAPLPAWRPGAHIDLALPGIASRQYSLTSEPRDAVWRVAVKHEPHGRGGSHWLHEMADEGVELSVTGPVDTFHFDESSLAPILFIAGGIGVTPIVAMAARAAELGREFQLHYAGSESARMPYLADLRQRHSDRLTIHDAALGSRLDIQALLERAPADTVVYACGPARMLEEIQASARGLTVRVENFTAVDVASHRGDTAFEVELALTGVTVDVPPGRTVLEVVEEAGAFVISSCREGTCGTCETPILAGVADHRDSILSPAERNANRQLYICVSRALTPKLVLDL